MGQTSHLVLKPLQINPGEKNVGGHGILCPPRLRKWGDTSPVSPPNCAHDCMQIQHIIASGVTDNGAEGKITPKSS